MTSLLTLSRTIDRITAWIGRSVSWLILVAVLISAGNAILRKAFGLSSNAWLEMQWYLFGAVFMMAAAWTLQKNEHVRIDVVSNHLSHRTRLWIDLICHCLFLMPFVLLMTWLSWPFFLRSYLSSEQSMNAGGLILWPAKFFILAGFVVLIAQGISEIIKKIALLHGDLEDPGDTPEDHLPPELREMQHVIEVSDAHAGKSGGNIHA